MSAFGPKPGRLSMSALPRYLRRQLVLLGQSIVGCSTKARVGTGRCDSPKISSRWTTPHAETAMLRDDNGNGGGRPSPPRNVLGERLELCSMSPMTGFFRDGCCDTGREDIGSHTVCAVMTAAFLEFSKSRGNDLSTPMPEFGFRGLKPGDRWCLCAPRWQEALGRARRPAWFCAPLTKALWATARSPISSASQWTWPDPCTCGRGDRIGEPMSAPGPKPT